MLSREVDGFTSRNNHDYNTTQQNNHNRNDLSSRSFSQYDRDLGGSGGRGGGEPASSRFRSRTPGPEFMRSREQREDEQYFAAQRGRDTARSKTPTSELFNKQASLSGTPDFIPASRYQSPPRDHPNYDQQRSNFANKRHNSERPVNNSSDFTDGAPVISQSQSYGAIAPYGNNALRSSARKQSTSFEYVEPRPSNLTRIPYLERIDAAAGAQHGDAHNRSAAEDDRFVDMTVLLQRQESGFGFRIIGGTEEGSQVRYSFLQAHVLLHHRLYIFAFTSCS